MKRNSLKISLTAAVMSMIISASPVLAAQNINVKFEGMVQPVKTDVINKDGDIFAGAEDVASMFDAKYDWNEAKKRITLTKDNKKVIMFIDSNKATVDNTDIDMPIAAQLINGVVMLPLRFISEIFDTNVKWDEASNTINIKYIDDNADSFLTLAKNADIDEDTVVLSYDEALDKAKKKSSSLKSFEENIEYLDDLRDDLSSNLSNVNQFGIVSNAVEGADNLTKNEIAQLQYYNELTTTIQIMRNIKSVDAQKSMKDVNETMINDGIELMLRNYITNIKSYEMQIALLEESIELGKQNIKNLELKHSLGYESDYNLSTAKIAQQTNESNLKTLKLTLDTQKDSLKSFIGLDSSKDVYVDFNITFDYLNDISLESYIIKKKQSDPSIVMKKNDVEVAEYTKRTSEVMNESEIKTRNDYNTATRALKDAQDNMETSIRTAYNNIKQLEENNKALLLAVDKAKEDYNSVVASYKAGKATEYQVNQAKLGILSAKIDVEKNALNYSNLVFSFEKPYLLAQS